MTALRSATRSGGDHVAAIISSVGLAFIGLGMLGLILTAWVPLPPLSRLAITVVNEPHVNGEIHVAIDYCKRSDLPPQEVRWALVDGVSVILPPYVMTLPKGCHVTTVSMPLNRSVAPGVYSLQVTGIYQPWPWREIVYTRQSQPFRLAAEATK